MIDSIIVFCLWGEVKSKFSEEFFLLPGMEKPLSLQVLDNKTLNTSTDTQYN